MQRLGDKAAALVVADAAFARPIAAVGKDNMAVFCCIRLINSTKLIIAVHILIPINRERSECF
jgi:hypothetical protein